MPEGVPFLRPRSFPVSMGYRMTPPSQRMRFTSPLAISLCLSCAQLLCVSSAAGQQVDQKLWGVDPIRALTAVAVSGQTLYVGGSFLNVAPVVGGGAIVDAVTGVLRHDSPRVAGIIDVCISDGRR